jgi:hypothetical protein
VAGGPHLTGPTTKIKNLRFSPGMIVLISGLFCHPCGTWFPLWLTYPGLPFWANLCRRSATGVRQVLRRGSTVKAESKIADGGVRSTRALLSTGRVALPLRFLQRMENDAAGHGTNLAVSLEKMLGDDEANQDPPRRGGPA